MIAIVSASLPSLNHRQRSGCAAECRAVKHQSIERFPSGRTFWEIKPRDLRSWLGVSWAAFVVSLAPDITEVHAIITLHHFDTSHKLDPAAIASQTQTVQSDIKDFENQTQDGRRSCREPGEHGGTAQEAATFIDTERRRTGGRSDG